LAPCGQGIRREARVAAVTWQDIDGEPVALACGTITEASNVETSLMQLVQEATVRAQAAEHAARCRRCAAGQGGAGSTASGGAAGTDQGPARVIEDGGRGRDHSSGGRTDGAPRGDAGSLEWPDRTERLANSLANMCAVVARLNAIEDCPGILLMAGAPAHGV
jgi:hypothetical protein